MLLGLNFFLLILLFPTTRHCNLVVPCTHCSAKRVLFFLDFSTLTHNYAGIGGAVYAVESSLHVYVGKLMTITFNIASHTGGGMFLYHSTLSSELHTVADISNNRAEDIGGGIYAINSIIVSTQSNQKGTTRPLQTLMLFSNNSAKNGGGLYFESGVQLRMQKVGDDAYGTDSDGKINTSIYFVSNFAHKGSAVYYVADETYFDVCGGSKSVINIIATANTECFIQVFSDTVALTKELGTTSIKFITNDSSSVIGSTLIFGGLLD